MNFKNIMKNLFKFVFGKTNEDTYTPIKKYFELKEKELPIVSYIIPARNEEKSIAKCIKSIIDADSSKSISLFERLIKDSPNNARNITKKMSSYFLFFTNLYFNISVY